MLALLVVYSLMATDYFKQRREYRAMASRTNEVAQLLAQVPPPATDLEERLSAAQSRLEEAQNSFPNILNTTGIIDAILRLAEEVGVKAIPLVTQPWTVENISDQDYSVFRLSVTATGTLAKLSDFISRLETDEPATLVIESLLMDQATETDAEFEAKLDIVVYARPPSPTDNEEAA